VCPPAAPSRWWLCDSHSHLDAPEFDADRAAVIARARAAGVMEQIVPAVAQASWAGLRMLARTETGVYPAYGLHPMYLAEHSPEHLDALRNWIEQERPVAVGECGLDFYLPDLDAETQRYYFRAQLELAREFQLPVIVHARRAVDEVIACVRRVGKLTGVIHSFSGSTEQARQLWDLGFMLGLGGPITYPRASRLRNLVATMPVEHLLLETDAPDQPVFGHQGQRNEPMRLTDVLLIAAALRGSEPATLAAQTRENAARLFKLPQQPSH
jgi:TatD DNase family protein